MTPYRIVKPTSIRKGTLPVGREVYPGDFGLSESHLEEMVKKGQASKPKPKATPKKEGSEE